MIVGEEALGMKKLIAIVFIIFFAFAVVAQEDKAVNSV
jgi:hypothetical protein